MVTKELMERATVLMLTCHQRLSGAARGLRSVMTGRSLDSRFSSGRFVIPFVADGVKRLSTGCRLRKGFSRYSKWRMVEEEEEEVEEEEEEEEVGVWKRTILMGVKCQPLEFSGAILYDSKGRRVEALPRTPLRSLLASAEE
ncbi:hypothetical protein KFK09_028386 [Dendrobium nobile]|uniref:Uncharacterized protein n=1 Tax=Dendrobium nobile TaxID=94219 RepID=A0A8T3A3E1_DENNO|nr:hypothetical protein KFK09_028386 [Dendrobium nobile]